MEKKKIKFAAIGDLLLTSRSPEQPGRGLEVLSQEVSTLLKSCDFVFANLECTLPGVEKVPTEPRVVATESQVDSLKDSGIHFVTLGNNHAFDCYNEGFIKLAQKLDEIGMPWSGAGLNIDQAARIPALEVNSQVISFICVVDKSSGPQGFAGPESPGVVPLDPDQVCRAIRQTRKTSDHVIVSPHWGMERFLIPSPEQMEQARLFIDAGASMVLGHHPHVLQGMELVGDLPVVYSLGNFMSSHVYWDNGEYLDWNRFERTGCIFLAELGPDGRVRNVQRVPTYDDGGQIRLETSGWGQQCLDKVDGRVKKGVTQKAYQRESFRITKLKPILGYLKWSNIKKIRPGHFKKMFALLRK